jgi:glucose uptake protein GlcU
MILGISDLVVLLIGMIYPSYVTIKQQIETKNVMYGKEYFVVFSIFYVSTEILGMSLNVSLVNLIRLAGVSCMVSLPQISKYAYDTHIIPFYEKHKNICYQ